MVYSSRCAAPAYCFCNATAKHVTKKSDAKTPRSWTPSQMYLFHTHACLQPLSLPTVYALHHSACLAPLLWFLLCFIPGVRLPSASSPSFPAGGDVSSGRFGTPCVVLGCWEVVQMLVGVLCTWEPHQQAVRCGKVFQGTERDIGITHCYLVYSVSQKSTKNLRKTNKRKAKTNKHTHTTPCSDCRICFRWISEFFDGVKFLIY